MLKLINKTILSFKTVTITVLFLSSLLILLWGIRFFHIDFLLNFLSENVTGILYKFPIWFVYLYSLLALTNLVTSILLFKRNIISVVVSKYVAGLLLLLITYHFFNTNFISLYEATEMVITLLFFLSLASYSKISSKKGYLSKFSRDITTVSLKIQEGCDHECSYCPIPEKKGSSKSDSLKNIIKNIGAMANEGIKDIVLIGDNVGDYGTGEKGNLTHLHSFFDLINELDKIGGIHRFTFLSITTPMISDKSLNFIKTSNRFSPDFSIKMDSASDTILEKMNRPFSLKLYQDFLLGIKNIIPEAYISVEIIVGFPGETDELFNETVQFLSKADISYICPSMYSNKIGTKAYEIKNESVSRTVRKKRKKVLSELSKKKLQAFYENQLGTEKTVLFENIRRGDFMYGYTENHIKVKTDWNPILGNTIHKIKLTGINRCFMLFDFVKNKNESNAFVLI